MTYHFHTRYLDCDGYVRLGQYGDGSIAIRLLGKRGEPLSTPTACLANAKPAKGHVFIRDYSEYAGSLKNLQDLGIIGPPIRTVQSGFVDLYECELLP